MSTHQSKFGRRYDEEFKREVAALAAQPGKTDEQVGRDLGVSAPRASRAGGDATAAPAARSWSGRCVPSSASWPTPASSARC